MSLADRRHHPRVLCSALVRVRGESACTIALVDDISAFGIALVAERPYEPGTRLELRPEDSLDKTVRSGIVRSSAPGDEGQFRLGVELEAPWSGASYWPEHRLDG